MKLAVLLIVLVLLLSGCRGYSQSDDRSFYQNIDTKDWPGDDLSERQILAAIQHFKSQGGCGKPWRWALIGPNVFLLIGTDYVLTRVSGGGYVPNLHYSRGYWGGTMLDTMSVPEAKRRVQYQAADDCKYGHR